MAEEHLLRARLGRRGARWTRWRSEASQKVEEAVATVQREPAPDPYKEDWCALASQAPVRRAHVTPASRSDADRMSITYLEAIREAQARALADDPRVFIYGQDVGAFGGAFKATKNLAQQFPGRVIDAPISEDAMVGLAVGAAIEGMRPIIEMQFADFSTVGFNQIVNQAATLFWRTSVPCPITIRLPSRRHLRQRAVPQPEPGGDLCALPGLDRDDAGHGGGRLQHAAGSGGDRRPGDLLRAQTALLPSQGRSAAHRSPARRQGAHRPRRAAT